MSRRIRRGLRHAAIVATASLVAVLPFSAPAIAETATPRVAGADLVSLSMESGELRMNFRDTAQIAAKSLGADPQSVRFDARGGPVGSIPDDPAFAFLGRPGTPVWSLWDDGASFPALDTTGIAPGTVTGDEITLDLASVEGPGDFAAYTLSAWGRPSRLLDSDGRTSARIPAGHRSRNLVWLFDAAGDYRVTLRASAQTASGTVRDEATYAVSVPAAPAAGNPAVPAPAVVGAPATPAPPAAAAGRQAASAPAATTATPGTARAAAAGRRVISDGHVDMGPQIAGGRMTIKLKDDATSPPTWRDLAEVALKVTDKAQITVPAGSGFAFLGKAGAKVYVLPQTQEPGIVWPGWNTQHPSVVSGLRGTVTWQLRAVDGPGEFKLFLRDTFGSPKLIFDSAKSLPQRLAVPLNTHAHGNWAFTKAGVYRLSVAMNGTTTGGKVVSDTKELLLAVGDGTSVPGGGGSGNGGNGDKGIGDKGTGAGGDDSAAGGGDETSGGGGLLAKTGANVVSVVGGGALLLVAGAAALILTRRRRGDA